MHLRNFTATIFFERILFRERPRILPSDYPVNNEILEKMKKEVKEEEEEEKEEEDGYDGDDEDEDELGFRLCKFRYIHLGKGMEDKIVVPSSNDLILTRPTQAF